MSDVDDKTKFIREIENPLTHILNTYWYVVKRASNIS